MQLSVVFQLMIFSLKIMNDILTGAFSVEVINGVSTGAFF